MEIGIVRPVSINDEMRTAYLEYEVHQLPAQRQLEVARPTSC